MTDNQAPKLPNWAQGHAVRRFNFFPGPRIKYGARRLEDG